jgi:hypothetical protein
MSIAIGGTAMVGISKDASNMGNMGNMATGTAQQNIIISFFSGFWGEMILLVSYGLMFFGIWSSGSKRVLPVAVVGAAILYVSMYTYFSIPLEITGSVVISFAFAFAFSDKLAKKVKLA